MTKVGRPKKTDEAVVAKRVATATDLVIHEHQREVARLNTENAHLKRRIVILEDLCESLKNIIRMDVEKEEKAKNLPLIARLK